MPNLEQTVDEIATWLTTTDATDRSVDYHLLRKIAQANKDHPRYAQHQIKRMIGDALAKIEGRE